MKRTRVFLARLGRRTVNFPNSTPPMGILMPGRLSPDQTRPGPPVNGPAGRECLGGIRGPAGRRFWRGCGGAERDDALRVHVGAPDAGAAGGAARGVHRGRRASRFCFCGFPEGALAGNLADAAVSGEGECALEQVIRARQAGADLTSIPGLLWRNGQGVITLNPGAIPLVEEIDSLPFPAYDLIDIRKYWALPPMAQSAAAQIPVLFQQPGLSVQVHLLSSGLRETVSGVFARAAGRRSRTLHQALWGYGH